MRARAESARPPAPFGPALVGVRLRLIAEVKKASPVAILRASIWIRWRGRAPTPKAGAMAISVLTEPKYFLGDIGYLDAIRAAYDAETGPTPALLRKDFLFDPYQLYEARAHGADAALLIVAVLGDPLLADLIALAGDLGLGALVEVHDEPEVERALRAGAAVIGINNRDLRTFHTDIATTGRLRPLIPPGKVVVSESGIATAADAAAVRAMGADAILVGESLMTTGDLAGKMRELQVGEGGS
ncbi:MAG: indole-3-glycerol phosphate synthase TrpC [Dehalococcoidia bacterium]